MSADYVVIDRTGAMIASFLPPYSPIFFTSIFPFFPPPPGDAYLILTVKTGYDNDHPEYSAAVLINGTTIGTIDPRPWTTHFFFPFETVIFPFPNTLLSGLVQTLQIVRAPDVGNPLLDQFNFLFVGDAICHYRA
jgi:hypothetical protein